MWDTCWNTDPQDRFERLEQTLREADYQFFALRHHCRVAAFLVRNMIIEQAYQELRFEEEQLDAYWQDLCDQYEDPDQIEEGITIRGMTRVPLTEEMV